MARATSAWARAGASLVPSPIMATNLPLACSFRMYSSFACGVTWATKSSTPAFLSNGCGGQRIVSSNHDRTQTHSAKALETLVHGWFQNVLEYYDSDNPKPAMNERFERLRRMGLRTVMIT